MNQLLTDSEFELTREIGDQENNGGQEKTKGPGERKGRVGPRFYM